MAISLTCPGCRDAVRAEEADRGKTIKCGTCWSDVSVPPALAAPAKAASIPTAKAIPTAPVATAGPATPAGAKKATPLPTATPAAPATPTAKPVVATALPLPAARPAPPAEPKGKPKKDEPETKKPRFKERDRDRYDDDDDDDRPRRSEKKGGGAGVLIAFICIGAVMLLGAVGAVAVMIMNGQQTAATTAPTTTKPSVSEPELTPIPPPRNPGGDFNPNPIPPPNPQAVRPLGWAEYKGKDFTCDMPVPVKKEAVKFDFATRVVNGTTYSAAEANDDIKVTVKELTLPAGTSATSAPFLGVAFGLPEGVLKKDPNGRLVNGHPGVEYTATTADGYQNAFLSVGVDGKNAFLFRIQWKPNVVKAEEKRDSFLASVSIHLEADVPVVRDPFGNPDPKQPKAITQPWKPLENKDGFAVELPPGAKKERHLMELDNRGGLIAGKKWVADDGDVMYHVFCHDLATDQLEYDLKRIVDPIVKAVFPHEVKGQEEAKVDGKPAVRWNIRHFHGGITHGVSVRVGYRVFTLFCTSKHGLFQAADATLNDRQDRFLNSIKVTFDPKTHNAYSDDADWVPVAKTVGFTALIPKQASSVAEFNPFFFPESPMGKEWKAEVDGIVYQVFVVDFSPNPKRNGFSNKTPADLVKWFTDREKVEDGPDNKAKLGNLNAEGYTLKAWGDKPTHVRFVSSGKLVFVAKTARSGDWNNKCSDKEYADKSAKFFSSFRLGDQVAVLPNGGGGEGAIGSTGDFVKLPDARVQPFWTGVFLSQKKEFITFGVKDAGARPVRGVVRRYSVPDFKLKATYETPSPINRAVADEANGRLFVSTVRDAEDARLPEKDNLIASGDVQQFDLNKMTDGTLPEAEQVKPVNVLSPGASGFKVSGLEVSPDGTAVYVSGVIISGSKAKPIIRGGKLMKWEIANSKFATDITTDAPVWALTLSADGKKLIGLERFTDAARPGGNLVLVDAQGWKRTGTTPLTGTPFDLSLRSDRVAVVTGQGKLLVGPPENELGELDLGGEMNYVRFTPGGTKLLVSSNGQASGLHLYEVSGAKPPKVTKVASADLSGMFIISPDGKLAVMNVGAVFDLEKSKAK